MKGLCLALSIGVIFWIHNETADVITARLIIEAESPDQLWKAAVVQTDYETWPIITIVTSDVYLISLRDPANVADILAVNTAGTDDIEPRISWSSANTLKVTVWYLPDAMIFRRNYGGVQIDIQGDPRGEAGHAEYLKQMEELNKAADKPQ